MKGIISALKKNIFGVVLVVFAVAVGSYSLFSETGSDMAVIADGVASESDFVLSAPEAESAEAPEVVSPNVSEYAAPEIADVPEVPEAEPKKTAPEADTSAAEPDAFETEHDASEAEYDVSETEPSENTAISDLDPTLYTYYYTPSGKKWHLKQDCRYLKNSKTIYSGTYDEVIARGLDPCSACGIPE